MYGAQQFRRVIAQRQFQPNPEQRVDHDVRAGDHVSQHAIALIVFGIGDEQAAILHRLEVWIGLVALAEQVEAHQRVAVLSDHAPGDQPVAAVVARTDQQRDLRFRRVGQFRDHVEHAPRDRAPGAFHHFGIANPGSIGSGFDLPHLFDGYDFNHGIDSSRIADRISKFVMLLNCTAPLRA